MSIICRTQRLTASVFALVLFMALVVGASGAKAVERSAYIDPKLRGAEGMRIALVHVRPEASLSEAFAVSRAAGAKIGSVFDQIKVFVAYGTIDTFREVARSSAIEWIEANRRLHYLSDNSHEATRGQDVLDGDVTLSDGTRIDGSGVGVAVVDTGVDGTHPDLSDRMGANMKMACVPDAANRSLFCKEPVAIPLPDTDEGGGHGTHVAGIVAGTGAASGGKYHGAAPGATLYGIGIGAGLNVIAPWGIEALQWVLDNHDLVSPQIRVVTNSWGGEYGTRYQETSNIYTPAIWKMQEALVADGVSVVFAAGNESGGGNVSTTSAYCVNPTPGVVCVANYDDFNSGTRDGSIYSGSSWGKKDPYPDDAQQAAFPHTMTWPDVVAPGVDIISTCRPHLPLCAGVPTENPALYSRATGTSMSAPHVAGIIAQLYQANPNLTPAEVENVLEDTAYKFLSGSAYGRYVDSTNPDDTSSYDKGHGLVDVLAAVRYVLGLGEPEPDPTPTASPSPTATPSPTEDGTYYFHSSTRIGNLDYVRKTARDATVNNLAAQFPSFNTTAPSSAEAATYYDVPRPLQVTDGGIYDPRWEGRISERIQSLDVRFWATPPVGVSDQMSYKVTVWIENKKYDLPSIVRPVPQSRDASLVEASFSTMLVGGREVPLDMGPANTVERSMAISIGGLTADDAGTYVEYDSVTRPSGFTINANVDLAETILSFTGDSAVTGQYSDDVNIGARLTDALGQPIKDADVSFQMTGPESEREWTLRTDADGIASTQQTLIEEPGSYQLTARYAGQAGALEASADNAGVFVVTREDTSAALDAGAPTGLGREASRTLTATISDVDGSSDVADRSVSFFSDGELLGAATTDGHGVAVFRTPFNRTFGDRFYEARFDGDEEYVGSSDSASGESSSWQDFNPRAYGRSFLL